jgi:hypothetical protein
LNKIDTRGENLDKFKEIALEMQRRREGISSIEKITWYYRHWKDSGDAAKEGVKNKSILPKSYIDDCEWDQWMKDDPRNP